MHSLRSISGLCGEQRACVLVLVIVLVVCECYQVSTALQCLHGCGSPTILAFFVQKTIRPARWMRQEGRCKSSNIDYYCSLKSLIDMKSPNEPGRHPKVFFCTSYTAASSLKRYGLWRSSFIHAQTTKFTCPIAGGELTHPPFPLSTMEHTFKSSCDASTKMSLH